MGVKKEITQTFFQKKRFSNDIKERNIKAKKEAVVEEAPKSLDVEQEDEDIEAELRIWDMDMKYGPCIGITRLERWERARKNGLSPPDRIRSFILSGAEEVSLWEYRV